MAASVLLTFTQSTPAVHAGLEWLAYFVGARVYFRRKHDSLAAPPRQDALLILAAAIFGAAAGAIVLHDLESLAWVSRQPVTSWISGKSVLGAFLGGTMATEIAKTIVGWRHSTGDRWVAPLVLGLMLGRIGCQLSGPWDMTYGSPTGSALGWDYGDGVPRFPTALLEILAVFALWLIVRRIRWKRQGQLFNAFLFGYCVVRFAIEFLKPPFGGAPVEGTIPVDLFLGLTAIQWAALLGAGWMAYRMRPLTETPG